jgi:hypothetical protein
VVSIGVSDGDQGMLFLVNDERKQANGLQTGVEIAVPDLTSGVAFEFEFWDSYDATRLTPVATQTVTSTGHGIATVAVPAFERTQAVKFYRSARPPAWDAGYTDIGGGWRRLSWFGDYAPMGTDGWIWHHKHGFFYVPSNATPENIWLYTQDMGWLYTGNTTYPFLYRQNDGAWLWYNGAVNPRWFRNMTAGTWESRP